MNIYKLRSKTFSIVCEKPLDFRCTSPRAAAPVLREIFKLSGLDESQEHFLVVVINPRGHVVGHKVLASGTATACLVTPEMLYRAALVLGGTSVLACHNHPSGSIEPSREDTALTKKLREAGEILSLPLADHIILGHEDAFYSFRSSEGWDRG